MRFGLILAVADALQSGQMIWEIKIDSLDPNVPMVNIGVKIWNEFLERIEVARKGDDSFYWLSEAISRLGKCRPDVHTVKLNSIEVDPAFEVWLSAIHIVYGGEDGSEKEVGESLSFLCSKINPQVGFITCHSGNLDIAKGISPYNQKYKEIPGNPGHQFFDWMPTPLTSERCRAWGFFPPHWRVFWQCDKNPEDTVSLTYLRKN